MKNMRKLVPAFAMLMVAAIMMSTASFAWFSMGTKATATGMEVKATTGSTMIISLGKELSDFMAANSSVPLAAQNLAAGMAPATGDASGNLTYVKNADEVGAIDAATGVADTAAVYEAAKKGEHYVEYIVYIGSAGGELDQDLMVELDIDAVTKNLHNALTVDFWAANSTGTLAYMGRINVDDTVDGSATAVKLADTIPQVTLDSAGGTVLGDYIQVVMRVYFDGALEDDNEAGYTYVRNTMITETAVELGINFYAQ